MRYGEHALSPENNSNLGQGQIQIYSNKSWGYFESDGKNWYTSAAMFKLRVDYLYI